MRVAGGEAGGTLQEEDLTVQPLRGGPDYEVQLGGERLDQTEDDLPLQGQVVHPVVPRALLERRQDLPLRVPLPHPTTVWILFEQETVIVKLKAVKH